MVICDNIGNDRLFIRRININIFRIKQPHKTKLTLGQVEGIVQVVNDVGLGQALILNQIRPEKVTV